MIETQLVSQLYLESAGELEWYVKQRLRSDLWTRFGEEVVPETFYRLQRDKDDYDLLMPRGCSASEQAAMMKRIAYGILKKVIYEMVRNSERHDHGNDGLETVADCADADGTADDYSRLKRAKKVCTKDEWLIIEMKAHGNLTWHEIGRIIGMSPEGVRSKMWRIRQRIYEAVSRDLG